MYLRFVEVEQIKKKQQQQREKLLIMHPKIYARWQKPTIVVILYNEREHIYTVGSVGNLYASVQ